MTVTEIKRGENGGDTGEECCREILLSLGREREPFAKAEISGREMRSGISGGACFYYTPLGVLAFVWIKGFESRRRTYDVSISDGTEGRGGHILPPLYERGGYAFLSCLTAKLAPSDVLDRGIVISGFENGTRATVAEGRISSFRAEKYPRAV